MKKDRRYWTSNDYAAARAKRYAILGAIIAAAYLLYKAGEWVWGKVF